MTDASGGLIMATGSCAKGVTYSSGWHRSGHDGKVIKIAVAPATAWALEMWTQ